MALPPSDDIVRYFLAADLFLHPAREENTGSVILEAIIAGTPVLCTAVCGFAEHVLRADAGRVTPEPFRQAEFDSAMAEMLASRQLATWSRNGISYGESANIYDGRGIAAELIEKLAGEKK